MLQKNLVFSPSNYFLPIAKKDFPCTCYLFTGKISTYELYIHR